jgi:hypothetical protein
MKEDQKIETPFTIKESDIKGEQIIFDILIKEKLAHVIVIKDGHQYHINLDGEDLGSFWKEADGTVRRYGQHKGANANFEDYFKPIEAKLDEMNK